MHIDQQPQFDNRPDNEGAMARADLYKLANYSLKLFKMMESNTQLEGWVQAKITKSADYIASVYHYLEYEMKFSEYGQAIDDSDVYTESQKRVLKAKLNEAKEKIKDLKKVQADKAKKKEKKEEISEARASDKKKGAVTKSEKSQYFAKTTSKDGKVTKGSTHEAEEGETEGDVRDRVERDAKSKGDTVDSFRKKDLDEAKKAKKDYDKDGKVESEKDEVIGSRRKAAGLSVKETAISGAPQKSGIAATAKTTVPGMRATTQDLKKAGASAALGEGKCNHTAKGKSCPVHGLKECGSYMEGKKPDFLDMDKDGDKKEPMKKAVADKKTGPKKGVNPFAKVKETAISGAPQKSGIPATAKTTVPGMRATPQDLKKAGASAVLGEGKCNRTAKGKSCPVHGLKECGGGMYEGKR